METVQERFAMSSHANTPESSRIPTIEWKNYYSVGDRYLDEQHKEIISLINWLQEAITVQQGQEAVPLVARRLMEYTERHFRDEETRMEEAGFPGLEEHVKKHKFLIEKTQDFLFQCIQGDEPPSREMLGFVKGWWIDHIMGDDKQYAPYVRRVAPPQRPALKKQEDDLRQQLREEPPTE